METLTKLISLIFFTFTVGCADFFPTREKTKVTEKITKVEKQTTILPKPIPVQNYTITSQIHTDMMISSGDTQSVLRGVGQCVKVTSVQFTALKIKVNVLPSQRYRSYNYREETCGSKGNICQPNNYNIISDDSTGPRLEEASSANTSEECKALGASFPKP